MTSTQLTADEVVERNLRVVDEHFHNENPVDIEKAIALRAGDRVGAAGAGYPVPR